MKIKMDDEIRATHAKFETNTQVSISKWLAVITFAVFMGTTASTLAVRALDTAIVWYELSVLNKKLAAEKAEMKARQTEQSKINAARLKQQQIENQKREAGYRQAMETCNFWREQYRKENTSYNKLQLDQSCDLVDEFR